MPENRAYPRPLENVEGPIPPERVERVLAGMGAEGIVSRRLVARGLAPPEIPTGLTLALLAGQPLPARRDPLRPTAVAGGVWVREQLTLHAPVPLATPLVISGASLRRFVRKGRRYAVSASETREAATGRLLATNGTTGLERYRAEPDLPDSEEGLSERELPVAGPAPDVAHANPSLAALRALRVGDAFTGTTIDISLDRLRERDGPRPENPIHSDPEAARQTGLDVPIAGGAHVLAFVQEVLLQAWGEEALSHGTHLDVRWKAPVRAGASIIPAARVASVSPAEVEVELEVRCADVLALVGRARIPLPGGRGGGGAVRSQ